MGLMVKNYSTILRFISWMENIVISTLHKITWNAKNQ